MQQVTGLISEVLHCTLNHGPGSRSTVVLKGCPLRCIWCQSPEAQHYRPEVLLDVELCRRCGQCVENCEPGRHQTLDQERVLRDGVWVYAVDVAVGGVAVGQPHDIVDALAVPQLSAGHGEFQCFCASHNVASTTPVEVCEPVKGGN